MDGDHDRTWGEPWNHIERRMENIKMIDFAPVCELELLVNRVASRFDLNFTYVLSMQLLDRVLGMFIQNDLKAVIDGCQSLDQTKNVITNTGIAQPSCIKANPHTGENETCQFSQ
jgi:hypothetical protein